MFYIIYETTNLINGMKYRGCHATEDLNDGYLGSGIYFKNALRKYGKNSFDRNILHICDNMNEMIAKEAELVDEEWVNNVDNYNLQTGGLSYGILSRESKIKIGKSVSLAHENGKYDYSLLKGREVWNKNKTNIYSEETLTKMKTAKINYEPWNKGKTGLQQSWNKGIAVGPMEENTKEKISNTLKEKFKTQVHHLKGKPSINKGRKTGIPSWNSGIIHEKNIKCPYCDALGASIGNMRRWHFENCKFKCDI